MLISNYLPHLYDGVYRLITYAYFNHFSFPIFLLTLLHTRHTEAKLNKTFSKSSKYHVIINIIVIFLVFRFRSLFGERHDVCIYDFICGDVNRETLFLSRRKPSFLFCLSVLPFQIVK